MHSGDSACMLLALDLVFRALSESFYILAVPYEYGSRDYQRDNDLA